MSQPDADAPKPTRSRTAKAQPGVDWHVVKATHELQTERLRVIAELLKALGGRCPICESAREETAHEEAEDDVRLALLGQARAIAEHRWGGC